MQQLFYMMLPDTNVSLMVASIFNSPLRAPQAKCVLG